jgi:glycerol kinase
MPCASAESMPRFVLALDQGTTGSTALVMDENLRVLARANHEFAQHFPQPGWVEHHFDEIYASLLAAMQEAISHAKIDVKDIAAIGITNQRETCGFWDRKTGAALAPAIVWQCRRTASRCTELKHQAPEIFKKTGLILDAYFSATKAEWLLRNTPNLAAKAERGDACFGTIDSYLVHRLSAGKSHVTDVTNASRTMLFDINRLAWDDDLCALFSVPKKCLPEVMGCAEVVAKTQGVPYLPDGIPISGIAGDQQAALFGQACFEPGMAKCTFGTGSFMLQNLGTVRKDSQHRLLTTIAWKVQGQVHYAMEGSVFIAGAVVQWLRDGLGFFSSSKEIESLALSVPDSGGVTLVPAFAGLGAPHWRGDARGVITGLTRGTTRAHIARAALEAIALQNFEVLEAMRKDSGLLTLLRVDGGASANDMLMQFQADMLGVPLSRPAVIETTGFGAGCLAALGAGWFNDLGDVTKVWKEEKRFTPQMPEAMVNEHLARWRTAVAKA